MAVEVESTSQVEEFLRVLRKRVWWIIVPFALLSSLGTAYAVIVPKKYVSSTTVIVRDDEKAQNQGTSKAQEGKVAKHLIRARNRLESALDDLKWPEWMVMTEAERDEYLGWIGQNLSVDVPIATSTATRQVVTIKFAHTDPQRAVQFVTKLFEKWKTEVLERDLNAAERAFESVKQARAAKQLDWQELTRQITLLRQTHGIAPPSQRYPGDSVQRGKDLFDKLAEEEEAFAALEEMIEEAQLKLEEDRAELAKMPDEKVIETEVAGADYARQIEGLLQTNQALERLLESEGYRPRHRKYQQIKDRIAANNEAIEFARAAQTETSIEASTGTNHEKLAFAAQIEKDEQALERLENRRERDRLRLGDLRTDARTLQEKTQELRALEAQRDNVREILDTYNADFEAKQLHLESLNSPDANPFEVLASVSRPNKPTEPNPVLIVLFSIFAGLALGLALAVVVEYSRNCFRSVNDITRVMAVPVLGTVNTIVTRRQARRRFLGRTLLAAATFGFVAVVGLITWAWAFDQQLLSSDMVASIEKLRASMK